MIARLRAHFAAKRALRNADPHTVEERALFREVLDEGKALRRRRRRARPTLKSQEPQW